MQRCRAFSPGPRLAVLAVEKFTHDLPAGCVRLTRGLAFVSIHALPGGRTGRFGGAALRALVGKTRFVRLQLKLFPTDGADLDWKSHLQYMIRRSLRGEKARSDQVDRKRVPRQRARPGARMAVRSRGID